MALTWDGEAQTSPLLTQTASFCNNICVKMWFLATGHFRVRQASVSVPTPLYLFFKTVNERKACTFRNTDAFTHTRQERPHEVLIDYTRPQDAQPELSPPQTSSPTIFKTGFLLCGVWALSPSYVACVINLLKWLKPYFIVIKMALSAPVCGASCQTAGKCRGASNPGAALEPLAGSRRGSQRPARRW